MTSDRDFKAQIEATGYECYRFRIKIPSAYADGITRISVYKHPKWAENGMGPWRCSLNAQSFGPFATREEASRAVLEAVTKQIEALQSISLGDLMPESVVTA